MQKGLLLSNPIKNVGISQALVFTIHKNQVKSELSSIQVLSVEMCLLIKCYLKAQILTTVL